MKRKVAPKAKKVGHKKAKKVVHVKTKMTKHRKPIIGGSHGI